MNFLAKFQVDLQNLQVGNFSPEFLQILPINKELEYNEFPRKITKFRFYFHEIISGNLYTLSPQYITEMFRPEY